MTIFRRAEAKDKIRKITGESVTKEDILNSMDEKLKAALNMFEELEMDDGNHHKFDNQIRDMWICRDFLDILREM